MTVLFVRGTVASPTAWRKLQLTPRRHLCFRLADGEVMERDVSQCDIRLDDAVRVMLANGTSAYMTMPEEGLIPGDADVAGRIARNLAGSL